LEEHNRKLKAHFGDSKPNVSERTLQRKLDKELITLKVCATEKSRQRPFFFPREGCGPTPRDAQRPRNKGSTVVVCAKLVQSVEHWVGARLHGRDLVYLLDKAPARPILAGAAFAH